MEAKDADLSALRINREQDPGNSGPRPKLGVLAASAAGIVLVGAIGLYGWKAAFAPAIEVKVATAAWTSLSQSNSVLTASGYVVAQRKASVASKGTGKLVFLGVKEGDRVQKDQIIARLDDSDIKASLDQARANLRLNEAELYDAKQSLSRQKNLLEKGLSSQAEYDGADARYKRVLASIEVAKATLTGAEVALENMHIRAPFDGTVLTKNADVGEMVVPMAASVGSRAAVVTIADMSSLEVEADVSESNIERITPGQPCEISLDAYQDKRYQGFVSKIVPTADRAKATVMVKVGFRSYDARVLPEMSAKVLFLTRPSDPSTENAKPVLTVPASAVTKRDGKSVVYLVREDRAIEVPVTTGREIGSLIEIKDGLTSGQKVVDKLDGLVRDGTKVKVQ